MLSLWLQTHLPEQVEKCTEKLLNSNSTITPGKDAKALYKISSLVGFLWGSEYTKYKKQAANHGKQHLQAEI